MESEENNLTFVEEDDPLSTIEDILQEMEDIISLGRQILFPNRATIDPIVLNDLIDKLRSAVLSYTDKIAEVISESDSMVEEAKAQADTIIKDAEKKAAELTSVAVPYNVREEAKKLLEKAICLAEEESE